MIMLNMYLIILSTMSLLMLYAPLLLSMSMKNWFEKSMTFECGMNISSTPRKPFSLRFFLLMILFIIFDIEIAFLLTTPILIPWKMQTMLFLAIFISVLSSGLIYEWIEGSLNWKL